jgi:hypothetical protein
LPGRSSKRGQPSEACRSNTGPLMHLGEAEALTLLSWTGASYIPKAVDVEMTQQNSLWSTQRPAWIQVYALMGAFAGEAAAWRQAGPWTLGKRRPLRWRGR